MENKSNIKKYVCLKSLPVIEDFKVNALFTYDTITKSVTFENGRKYNNIDINNKDYFKEIKVKFDVDDLVIYNNQLCRVVEVDYKTGNCKLREYYSVIYYDNIYQRYLTRTELFWFINTKGTVCCDYLGHHKDRDKWCRITNNIFSSNELANARKKTLENDYYCSSKK